MFKIVVCWKVSLIQATLPLIELEIWLKFVKNKDMILKDNAGLEYIVGQGDKDRSWKTIGVSCNNPEKKWGWLAAEWWGGGEGSNQDLVFT